MGVRNMISAIVSVNNDWGIGYNGNLLEHIPEDLKYFKTLTTGHAVVMGSKTWDSLPKKPLPDRMNIIISHEGNLLLENGAIRLKLEDLNLDYFETDVFIIGGGSIYQQLLPFCDRVYVTKIYKSHEQVDTYFPNLDELDDWASTACGPIQTYKDLTYQFW